MKVLHYIILTLWLVFMVLSLLSGYDTVYVLLVVATTAAYWIAESYINSKNNKDDNS